MSALPPKADMFSVEIDVRFVPLADVIVQLTGPAARYLPTAPKAARQPPKPLEQCDALVRNNLQTRISSKGQ